MITTTLKEIRANSPCEDGWETLLKHLGKSGAQSKTDETPLPVMTVLESNGIDDTLWVLDNCCDPYLSRLIAADFAEHVLHIFEKERPDDDRRRKAIETARDPNASGEDLAAAWDAAWDAERAAARAARDAWDAERAAARAARDAWDAERAAWDAAAWDAAWDAERAAARAAWDAAWDAERAAARAAWDAAAWDAERAAARAARDAERAAQERRLRQYLEHGVSAKDMEWPE